MSVDVKNFKYIFEFNLRVCLSNEKLVKVGIKYNVEILQVNKNYNFNNTFLLVQFINGNRPLWTLSLES